MNDKCKLCKNYICDRCIMAEDPYSCNTFTEREKHEFKLETSFNVNDDISDFTKTLMNYSQIKIEKHIEKKLIEHGFIGEFNKENFRKYKVKIDFDIKNMVLIKNNENLFFICADDIMVSLDNKDEKYHIIFFKKYELGDKNDISI